MTSRASRILSGWWNVEGWPTAAEWGALWTFATFGVALGAAVLAFGQLRIILLEREERERPYVTVDFEFRSLLVLIAVENTSNKLATDVTLRSSPVPRSSQGDRLGRIEKIFDGSFTIRQLAPHRRMSWHIDTAPELLNSDELPTRFEVVVRYCDPLARPVRSLGYQAARPTPKWYEDTYVLDLLQYGESATEQDYDNRNWNAVQRNERRLERISVAAERIASGLSIQSSAQRTYDDLRESSRTRRRVIGKPRIRGRRGRR
ncbi:hypothetical protein GCM10027411_03240 [Microbacterium aureliae]